MLDKGFLDDERLSFKAKGILAYLLSKPDNWKVIVKDLINHSADGKTAIYSGLRELKKYGYYKKEPVRDEFGQRIAYWESVIYESPAVAEQTGAEKEKNKKKKSNKKELKGMEKRGNRLHADFQEIENVYIENRQRNNIYQSKEKYNQDRISIYPTLANNDNMIDNTEEAEELNRIINADNIPKEVAEKISLAELQAKYEDRQEDINMLYDVVCEVLQNKSPNATVRISKQNVPVKIAQKAFVSLDRKHIEYVIDSLNNNNNKHKINTNTKSYLLTSLFHSIRTIGYYYYNKSFSNNSNSHIDLNYISGKSSFDIHKFFDIAVQKSFIQPNNLV